MIPDPKHTACGKEFNRGVEHQIKLTIVPGQLQESNSVAHRSWTKWRLEQIRCLRLNLERWVTPARQGRLSPLRPLAQIPPQSHRASLFYGVRYQSMGKLQAPKARSCDCRRQEAPRD